MDTTHRDPKDVAENKDLAALGYVWILSIVVLFAKRGSPFAQYHARQGAALFALSLVVWAMPFVGKLAEVLVLAMCIVGFLHAAQGEWREVPIVGPLSRGSVADVRGSWKDVVAACTMLWARMRGTAAPRDAEPKPSSPPTSAVIDVPFTDAPSGGSDPVSEHAPSEDVASDSSSSDSSSSSPSNE